MDRVFNLEARVAEVTEVPTRILRCATSTRRELTPSGRPGSPSESLAGRVKVEVLKSRGWFVRSGSASGAPGHKKEKTGKQE